MIEERIEKLQSELGKVQAELDELKAQMKTPEDRFVPKVGVLYWCVDSHGDCDQQRWRNSPIDEFRLATGNVHITKEDARRYKAKLYLTTLTGPCPQVGDYMKCFSLYGARVVDYGICSGDYLSDVAVWDSGRVCIKGYEAELEAKWKRYGWSVTGEPAPEGWES